MSRIESTEAIQDALTRGMVSATLDGMTAVAAGFTLFLYAPILALVVVGALLIVLGLGFAFSPLTHIATAENIVALATEQSHLIETMRAMPTIKLMGGENEREGKWGNRYAGVINGSVRMGRYEITLEFPQNVGIGIQTVLVIYLGAREIPDAQGFSVGMLFAFLSFRQTFSDRAQSQMGELMQFRLHHLERLADNVNAEPDIAQASDRPPRMTDVAGGIELRNLSFR